jgi:hypothetical protein
MIKSLSNSLNTKGHLTIHKVVDGDEELLFDDKNVIVSGFGWALAYLFSNEGSSDVTDFQIDRFKLGVSGDASLQVSSTNDLSGALSSVAEYVSTGDSNLVVEQADQWINGSVTNDVIYARIPYTKVTKVDDRTVRYTIFVDEDSCNDLSRPGIPEANLNEIGLFIKNPRDNSPVTSVLAAYRSFSDIRKTSDFGLVFRWTITFG